MTGTLTLVMMALLGAPEAAPVPDAAPAPEAALVVPAPEAAPAPEVTPAPDTGLSATLAVGWAALTAGHYDVAEAAYLQATALEPRSEDAWLGLQGARLARHDWLGATAAGAQALALDERNYWAQSRQAWARFNLADYAAARQHYQAALAAAPGDAEMALGLGFTLARLGNAAGARAQCAAAAVGLAAPGDARVAACHAEADALDAARAGPTGVVGVGLSATYLADGVGLVNRVYSGALVASATWPKVTLWAGVTSSDTAATDGVTEALVAGHFGLALRLGAWDAALSGAWLSTDLTETDGTGVVMGRLGWSSGSVTLGLETGAMLLPAVTALQLDPRLTWRVTPWLALTVGPELARSTGRVRVSGYARLDVALAQRLGLWTSGSYGDRQYPLDAGGLAFWTGDDRFQAGYQVGLDWAPTDAFALHLTGRQDFLTRGTGQGQGATTTLSGVTLGVGANF